MTANSGLVSGSQVPGTTNIVSGHELQNGAVITTRDDIASINAANAMAPPRGGFQTDLGKIWGAKNKAALPGGAKDGGQ